MYTGLIETIGTVVEYQLEDSSSYGGNGMTVSIGDCSSILSDVEEGDSVGVNGVCLTVTGFGKEKCSFKAGISPETIRRSTLGELREGSKVNLERSAKSDARIGGHVVQGHVDTIAQISNKVSDGEAIKITMRLRDKQNMNYIVEKGFIAIDGTSLTVTDVNYLTSEFSIMMIPYTQEKVILPTKYVGDWVNIEVDFTGKIIEKQLENFLISQASNDQSKLALLIDSIVEKKMAGKST